MAPRSALQSACDRNQLLLAIAADEHEIDRGRRRELSIPAAPFASDPESGHWLPLPRCLAATRESAGENPSRAALRSRRRQSSPDQAAGSANRSRRETDRRDPQSSRPRVTTTCRIGLDEGPRSAVLGARARRTRLMPPRDARTLETSLPESAPERAFAPRRDRARRPSTTPRRAAPRSERRSAPAAAAGRRSAASRRGGPAAMPRLIPSSDAASRAADCTMTSRSYAVSRGGGLSRLPVKAS